MNKAGSENAFQWRHDLRTRPLYGAAPSTLFEGQGVGRPQVAESDAMGEKPEFLKSKDEKYWYTSIQTAEFWPAL